MTPYDQIPIWENCRRLRLLRLFRSFIATYCDFREAGMGDSLNESERQDLRSYIKHRSHTVRRIIIAANVSTFSDPPSSRRMDVIHEFFNFAPAVVGQRALDVLDEAIGAYQDNRHWLLWRTLRFCLAWPFKLVVAIPLEVLVQLGFNRDKLEVHWLSRLYQMLAAFVVFFVSVLGILDYLGLLDGIKALLQPPAKPTP